MTMGFSSSYFSTMPSSSSATALCCGLEATQKRTRPLHVHAAPTAETFSWSDFPIIIHQEEDHCLFAVRLPATAPTAADFSSSSWFPPTSASYSIQNNAAASESKEQSTRKKKKIVRFAPSLEIRTHSLVLGEHPWCEDGLAIDLGWEYDDSHDDCMQQQQEQEQQLLFTRRSSISTRLRHNRGSPRRRSYLERKRLLLEVGGYTKEELELILVFEEKEGQQQQNQQSQIRISRVGSINKSLSLFSTTE